MRCTIVLEFDDGDGSAVKRVEVMRLHRAAENPTSGDVGLSLAEGKSLVNCIQQNFVVEQLERFCASRRACAACGVPRRLHDNRCSELKTTLGKVFYCRERWKACKCGADACRYVSPLKNYFTDVSTGELRWLHAELGATMPYRQAKRVMDLLLPTSGRDSHVTIRNHTVTIGKSIQHAQPVHRWCEETKPDAELGIDVGYVRRARNNSKGSGKGNRVETDKGSSSIAVIVAALGPAGKRPRVWASAMPRTKRMQKEMTRFLEDSGYDDPNDVCVRTDGALDLAGVANDLPFDSEWVLDWAHIGRMLRYVDQTLAPLAYGRLTTNGSAFELWDLFVRFRSLVWTGQTVGWQRLGKQLHRLLELREKLDPNSSHRAKQARYRLTDVIAYLERNLESLIDYRAWQRVGRRISTGFVESSINRIVGRRMGKSQHMRWSRAGAHSVVQVRVALLNQEFHELAGRQFPWIGQRRVSWPWQ
ncbi:ISKra4 family transposase [Trinickia violacea]|uniref:ISKra4 family transposase n=1 Tax=Trinickia violacea TaxID=2571746 RepID=A0A4P8IPS3_9BURK|nr:ISKra4 family transposase [Trinickia violacea]QCP50286.1 ISKra4 family transposase [Trinickia violacea]